MNPEKKLEKVNTGSKKIHNNQFALNKNFLERKNLGNAAYLLSTNYYQYSEVKNFCLNAVHLKGQV